MSQKGTVDSRLKQIRKELSLIDDDLKSLSQAAADPSRSAGAPKLKYKELREKAESAQKREAVPPEAKKAVPAGVVKGAGEQGGKQAVDAKAAEHEKDERFVSYLSSSFDAGRPLGQERRIQRNKAILMLIIVFFILFALLYRMFF